MADLVVVPAGEAPPLDGVVPLAATEAPPLPLFVGEPVVELLGVVDGAALVLDCEVLGAGAAVDDAVLALLE